MFHLFRQDFIDMTFCVIFFFFFWGGDWHHHRGNVLLSWYARIGVFTFFRIWPPISLLNVNYKIVSKYLVPHILPDLIPPFFRCQVWGVHGLPTVSWISFPLFLRCQVWGVLGLPTSLDRIFPNQLCTPQHWPLHPWSCSTDPLVMLSFCTFYINSQTIKVLGPCFSLFPKWMLQTLTYMLIAFGNV